MQIRNGEIGAPEREEPYTIPAPNETPAPAEKPAEEPKPKKEDPVPVGAQ